jgi:hypothetical protein
MRWEALFWSLFAIAAPGVLRLLWRRFDPSVPHWAQPIVDGAGWLHGLMLPYLALLTGSVPGGLVGLYAIAPYTWFAGGMACLLGLLAVFAFHRIRPRNTLQMHGALSRWQDEPRWALYRASGAIWLQDITLGAGLGFLLSGLEWLITGLAQKPRRLADRDLEPLHRSGISTILFILTRNFWLTAGTQLVFFLMLEIWAGEKQPVEPAAEEQT